MGLQTFKNVVEPLNFHGILFCSLMILFHRGSYNREGDMLGLALICLTINPGYDTLKL